MDIKEIGPWNWGKKMPALKDASEESLQSLQHSVSRMFEDFFDRFRSGGGMLPVETDGGFSPRVNVTEDDKAIKISAELPGMEEKDLDVSLTRDALTLKGEKKHEHEEEGRNFYRVERSFGRFQRTIPLPCEVEADKVQATFKKGVLTVTLPKSPAAQKQTKHVAIHAE